MNDNNITQKINGKFNQIGAVKKVFEPILSSLAPFLALLVLMIVLSITTEHFLTVSNLLNVLLQVSIIGIMSVGMTYVLITAGVDLSVGSIAGMAGIAATVFLDKAGANPDFIIVAVLIGIMMGVIAGFINGLLITYVHLPAFIATLGMLSVARGMSYVLSDGVPVYNIPSQFNWLGQGSVLGIPVPIYFLVVIAAIFIFLLNRTKFGLYTYAIGSNPETARMSGISIKKHLIWVYMLNGCIAGIAGILLASRTASGQPTAGQTYELDVIAACVIGGTSLFGGKGRIIGSLIGAVLMGVIRNGSNLLGISAFWQLVLIGAIIWLAVAWDSFRRGVKSY